MKLGKHADSRYIIETSEEREAVQRPRTGKLKRANSSLTNWIGTSFLIVTKKNVVKSNYRENFAQTSIESSRQLPKYWYLTWISCMITTKTATRLDTVRKLS